MQSIKNMMLAWNPSWWQRTRGTERPGDPPYAGCGAVAVFPHPDYGRLSRGHELWLQCRGKTAEHRKMMLFIEIWHLTLRDGIPPEAIHRALWNVQEYRDGLSDDMPSPEKLERRNHGL